MIPDFKTYIKESLWSDIQDRSAGDSIRKEDDPNNLDLEEFCSFLNSRYHFFDMSLGDTQCKIIDNYLDVPLFMIDLGQGITAADLRYTPVRELISIRIFEEKYIKIFFDLLREKFETPNSSIIITKGFQYITIRGEITNQFVVNVIDFVINNLQEPLKPLAIKK